MTQPRILLVDDEPHITHVVARKLRGADLEVTIANDGEEALEIANEEDIALIVTDLQMPYMSGIELAIELARHHNTKHIPIVMLTARGYILEDDEISATNIRKVLPKPFSAAELLDLVLNLLAERNNEEQAA